MKSLGARRSGYALLALLLIAALVRVYGIGDASYWLDEFYSLECSTGRGLAHAALPVNVAIENPPQLTTLNGAPPWWRIWTSLDLDNHPPLYFVLLRAWRGVVVNSEGYLRLMSALASLGGVAFFYYAARAQVGEKGALAAAAVLAVASSQVHFAQELRGYALWAMLALAAAWAVVEIERQGAAAWRLVVLGVATLGMMLTHYFAGAVAAGLGLYCLMGMRGRTRTAAVGAMVAAGVVYAATWGPFLLRQRKTVAGNNLWQLDPAPNHVLHTLQRVGMLPVRWLSETVANKYAAGWPGVVIAAGTGVALIALVWALRRDRVVWFWLAFAAPLVAMVAGLDLVRHARHLDVTRYTFVASPLVCMLVGLVVARFRGAWRWVVPVGVVAVCIGTIRGAYSDLDEWPIVAGTMRLESVPGDVFVYASGGREPWWAGSCYLGVSHYFPNGSHRVVLMTDPAAAREAVRRALPAGATVWIVCARENVSPLVQFPGATVIQSVGSPNIGRISQVSWPPAPATRP